MVALAAALIEGGATALVGSNRVSIYSNPAETYQAMLRAIQSARKTVHLETYIFRDDETGQKFADELLAAAARGVETRVMVDWFGCLSTSAAFFERLRQGGVALQIFNPVKPWQMRLTWPLRDHRKILACDGRIAFMGSLNIGSDFCGHPDRDEGWLESHLRVEGPGARLLHDLFEETWDCTLKRRPWWRPPREACEEQTLPAQVETWADQSQLRVLKSGTWRDRREIGKVIEGLLRRSRHRITIMNPYFVPNHRILKEIRQACRRGVQVRLMFSANTDCPPVWYASRKLYSRLMAWGAEIWLWQGSHLHSKVIVVDDSWSAIGSYNFDNFSAFRNLEVAVAVSSRTVAGALEWMFEKEKARSTRLEPADWSKRPMTQKLLERIAYFFRYWL